MTKKTQKPATDRDLLEQARGQLFTAANRFEAHGLSHVEIDKLLTKIDAHLATDPRKAEG
ncbi:hypothetical protein [Caulobacter sp. X]|uniref:hypothetical protein n=1 Tax=Caulobacter sp. X TaxID=2048901 RepID=UPI000C145BD6|nr:hypothetical protein [Caulobacter sp. X]PIB96482.1 hypothetical protein CSW60_18410 [Caulobacter sp. X]